MGKFDGILIACDIDGTLLDDSKSIPRRNVDAVEYFVMNGGFFTLATGRTARPLVEKFCDKIKLNAPGICSNGSQIFDFEKLETLWLDPISKEESINFILPFKEKFPDVAIEITAPDNTYILNMTDFSSFHERAEGFKFIDCDVRDIPEPWIKLMLVREEEFLDEVEQCILYEWKYPEINDAIRFVRSAPFFLEVLGSNVSKGKALQVLKGMIGARVSAAIGDGLNDIEMLLSADLSFAPGNSKKEAKDAATRVVGLNVDGAVADVIEYFDAVY